MRLEAVTHRYGDVDVLQDVDLDLDGHVVVHGPNGSGKSTLLRIVAGAAEPTRGRVVDRPRHVAYLPERFSPPAALRADDYLRRTARVLGLSPADATRRTTDLLGRLDLRPGPSARLGALSKGNRLKVGLAHAFCAPVGLVVLDEPRDGLDAAASAVLGELVDEAVGRGAVVVRAVHDDVSPGAVHLRVGGGRVQVMAGRSQGVRVRVRDAGGAVRTLVLDPAERDATLLRVLQAGGSVLEVRSAEGSPVAGASTPADLDPARPGDHGVTW